MQTLLFTNILLTIIVIAIIAITIAVLVVIIRINSITKKVDSLMSILQGEFVAQVHSVIKNLFEQFTQKPKRSSSKKTSKLL